MVDRQSVDQRIYSLLTTTKSYILFWLLETDLLISLRANHFIFNKKFEHFHYQMSISLSIYMICEGLEAE